MRISVFFALCICLLTQTSCGYRWGDSELKEKYTSIVVPYAQGDDSGLFTAALIRRLVARGPFVYNSYDADLLLQVCLVAPEEENIGFVYGTQENEGVSKIVFSNEARLIACAEVSLIERCSGCCLFGPVRICSCLDYDFEPDLTDENTHRVSLGQLEMHPLAQETAYPAVYQLLAEKIVDYVSHSW